LTKHDNRRGLVLFFTLGVSLADWHKAGFLQREAVYYQRLAEHIGPVTFITYGGAEDLKLGDTLDGIRVLNNPHRLAPDVFVQQAPELYHMQLDGAAIVKSNQIKGAQAAIRAAALTGARAIIRGGYLLSRFLSNRSISLRARFGLWRRELVVFHRADRIFLPTGEDARYARRWYALPPEKVVVVPNFVDTTLFTPRDEVACQPGLVCFVGRIAPQKNVPALIEAMTGLKNARLRLVGDGPDREMVRALAAERGVQVEMVGYVSHEELPRLLAECEIFVLPSLYEGLPKALLEAMSAEVPVIATKVQGSESLIRHLETGWLCEDTSPQALRRGLEALLSNADLRVQIGQTAREFVLDHFSLESVLARELAVYEEMGLV
jgi:glycosyltransferase involved in cell wall biosynthesis